MIVANTFDLEPWWATIPPSVPFTEWDYMGDRSERPLSEFLDLCDEYSCKATFFVVGWYAKKFPKRIREISRRGHELGSHSFFHDDISAMTLDQFRRDIKASKEIIQQAASDSVISFRAPSFSLHPINAHQYFKILKEEGYKIDSSITDGLRFHGGGFGNTISRRPKFLCDDYGVDLFEIPVPSTDVFGRHVQLFGGGYLRIVPEFMVEKLLVKSEYQCLYIHAHDFDKQSPLLPTFGLIGNLRRKMYIGNMTSKIRLIFSRSRIKNCRQIYLDSCRISDDCRVF